MSSPPPLDWRPQRVAIIGVGLLGGSLGLGLRARWPDLEIFGVARRPETRRAALEIGAVTQATDDIPTACRDCDLVVVATPVDQVASQICLAARHCRDDALITDVGSTKAGIVSQVAGDPSADRLFIGSHPIAGSEKSGPEFARGDLFEDRVVVVTPSETTPPRLLLRATELWQSLGGRVVRMLPAQHDQLLAATSHLPHLVAAALAAQLPDEGEPLVGSGWRDTTRVAAGAPELWTAICLENAEAIAGQLERMIASLDQLRGAVADRRAEEIHSLLESARRNRCRLDERTPDHD